MAFTIGLHRIDNITLVAPMSGVTDAGYRREAIGFGAGLAVSEMVASDRFVKGEEEARLKAEGAGVGIHVVQLAGCQLHWLAEGAKLAEGAGASIIDINMGCPAKRVTGGYAGSALMRDLAHAVSLIEATVAAVRVPVTVKMRLGWDDATLNAPELAARAVAAGAQMITVHGRTRQQFYKGSANWRAIKAVRERIPVPLIVNGDIATTDDARTALDQSGADGVMIGRAGLGRPWLAGHIARRLQGLTDTGPSRDERKRAALRHYAWLIDFFGRESGLRHARKHVAAYFEDADPANMAMALRTEALTSNAPDFVLAALTRVFDEIEPTEIIPRVEEAA
jgi:tRNA-dihydrouridine synthase B